MLLFVDMNRVDYEQMKLDDCFKLLNFYHQKQKQHLVALFYKRSILLNSLTKSESIITIVISGRRTIQSVKERKKCSVYYSAILTLIDLPAQTSSHVPDT